MSYAHNQNSKLKRKFKRVATLMAGKPVCKVGFPVFSPGQLFSRPVRSVRRAMYIKALERSVTAQLQGQKNENPSTAESVADSGVTSPG